MVVFIYTTANLVQKNRFFDGNTAAERVLEHSFIFPPPAQSQLCEFTLCVYQGFNTVG